MDGPKLDEAEIVETLETLHRRIQERFPRAHLAAFAGEIVELGRQASEKADQLGRPIVPLRIAVGTVLVGLVALLAYSVRDVVALMPQEDVGEAIQSIEATISSVVFLGAAALFLATLEIRVKRRRVLAALHDLRGLAHVIDMHQLAKDPKDVGHQIYDTVSSPRVDLSPYELSRYLDYCSELLSVVNKLGALYVRHIDDPVVLAGVDGLQHLVDGLSQKIWHKMTILDRMVASAEIRAQRGRG